MVLPGKTSYYHAITFRYEMHLQEQQQQVNCNFVFVTISFWKVNAEYEVLSQNSHAPVHTILQFSCDTL